MPQALPAVLMRGGTSRGLIFHERDLPPAGPERDALILAAYGSPDPNRRQTDGVGGGYSTTSKVAIVRPSSTPGCDVDYLFGQVSVDQPKVEYRGNCGNMSAAVGPFAVDEGLVRAVEPFTPVRIHQANTGKLITASVPVRDGRFDTSPGASIRLRFFDPGGSMTGALFPTGSRMDTMALPDGSQVTVTIIDAANPAVFLRAADAGLTGRESDDQEITPEARERLERIRCLACVRLGLAATVEEAGNRSQSVPKIAVVCAPVDYVTREGRTVSTTDADLVIRAMSMGTLHAACAVSVAIAAAGAAMVPGSIPAACLVPGAGIGAGIRLGHPGGVIEVHPVVTVSNAQPVYQEAGLDRTARRLMEGRVLVPD
jgi:hypothetical protein